MGAWRLVGDIAGWVAACALVTVLVWAAIERGRVHRRSSLHRGVAEEMPRLFWRVGWVAEGFSAFHERPAPRSRRDFDGLHTERSPKGDRS